MSGSGWRRASFDRAVQEGADGLAAGGVPVGASLDIGGRLVASGRNRRVQDGDPTAHGEISCLRAAGRRGSYRDAVLYTTLAPCAMCAGAIVQFGIPLVVVGQGRTFPGELDLLRERGVRVELLDDPRCVELMERFEREYPRVWAEDIGIPPDARGH
ncbi:nucleoside deaminase [Tomitella cavernea]|nr:nucleoside deaminase [Tomitella cavernea]